MRGNRQSGFALVSVLSVVLILSVMAAGMVALSRSQTRTTTHLEQQIRSDVLAEAATNIAILRLSDPRPEKRWVADRSSHDLSVFGQSLTVMAADELGRIDLNSADDDLLRALLEAADVDADGAFALVDAIRDWTDPDELRRLKGAELEDYLANGRDYGPSNQPFEKIDELALVLGITDDLYSRLQPALTVYTGRRNVDPQHAGALVQAALANPDDEGLTLSTSPQQNAGLAMSLGGRAIRVEIRRSHGEKQQPLGTAVVRFTDDPKEPVWFLEVR